MPRVLILTALAILLWLGACSDDSSPEPEPPRLVVPDVTIVGHGHERLGEITISGGVGTCAIDGAEVAALVYQLQDWPEHAITVHHVVAPTDSLLHVIYLYSAADTLRTIWHESYRHELSWEQGTGTVSLGDWTSARVSAIACLDAPPRHQDLVLGLRIEGFGLSWADGAGYIELEAERFSLHPFQLVDCRDCGATPDDGWYEAHAVMAGPNGEMEFGVLYMHLDNPDQVDLHHRFSFCKVAACPSVTIDAAWELSAKAPPAATAPDRRPRAPAPPARAR